MVFDLVSYSYQLLVVTNTRACVPHTTLHMHMKKSWKYPPCFTPPIFSLAHCCQLFLSVLNWLVTSMMLTDSALLGRTLRKLQEQMVSMWVEIALLKGTYTMPVSSTQGNADRRCLPTHATNTRDNVGRGDGHSPPIQWRWQMSHRMMSPALKGNTLPRSPRRQRRF